MKGSRTEPICLDSDDEETSHSFVPIARKSSSKSNSSTHLQKKFSTKQQQSKHADVNQISQGIGSSGQKGGMGVRKHGSNYVLQKTGVIPRNPNAHSVFQEQQQQQNIYQQQQNTVHQQQQQHQEQRRSAYLEQHQQPQNQQHAVYQQHQQRQPVVCQQNAVHFRQPQQQVLALDKVSGLPMAVVNAISVPVNRALSVALLSLLREKALELGGRIGSAYVESVLPFRIGFAEAIDHPRDCISEVNHAMRSWERTQNRPPDLKVPELGRARNLLLKYGQWMEKYEHVSRNCCSWETIQAAYMELQEKKLCINEPIIQTFVKQVKIITEANVASAELMEKMWKESQEGGAKEHRFITTVVGDKYETELATMVQKHNSLPFKLPMNELVAKTVIRLCWRKQAKKIFCENGVYDATAIRACVDSFKNMSTYSQSTDTTVVEYRDEAYLIQSMAYCNSVLNQVAEKYVALTDFATTPEEFKKQNGELEKALTDAHIDLKTYEERSQAKLFFKTRKKYGEWQRKMDVYGSVVLKSKKLTKMEDLESDLIKTCEKFDKAGVKTMGVDETKTSPVYQLRHQIDFLLDRVRMKIHQEKERKFQVLENNFVEVTIDGKEGPFKGVVLMYKIWKKRHVVLDLETKKVLEMCLDPTSGKVTDHEDSMQGEFKVIDRFAKENVPLWNRVKATLPNDTAFEKFLTGQTLLIEVFPGFFYPGHVEKIMALPDPLNNGCTLIVCEMYYRGRNNAKRYLAVPEFLVEYVIFNENGIGKSFDREEQFLWLPSHGQVPAPKPIAKYTCADFQKQARSGGRQFFVPGQVHGNLVKIQDFMSKKTTQMRTSLMNAAFSTGFDPVIKFCDPSYLDLELLWKRKNARKTIVSIVKNMIADVKTDVETKMSRGDFSDKDCVCDELKRLLSEQGAHGFAHDVELYVFDSLAFYIEKKGKAWVRSKAYENLGKEYLTTVRGLVKAFKSGVENAKHLLKMSPKQLAEAKPEDLMDRSKKKETQKVVKEQLHDRILQLPSTTSYAAQKREQESRLVDAAFHHDKAEPPKAQVAMYSDTKTDKKDSPKNSEGGSEGNSDDEPELTPEMQQMLQNLKTESTKSKPDSKKRPNSTTKPIKTWEERPAKKPKQDVSSRVLDQDNELLLCNRQEEEEEPLSFSQTTNDDDDDDDDDDSGGGGDNSNKNKNTRQTSQIVTCDLSLTGQEGISVELIKGSEVQDRAEPVPGSSILGLLEKYRELIVRGSVTASECMKFIRVSLKQAMHRGEKRHMILVKLISGQNMFHMENGKFIDVRCYNERSPLKMYVVPHQSRAELVSLYKSFAPNLQHDDLDADLLCIMFKRDKHHDFMTKAKPIPEEMLRPVQIHSMNTISTLHKNTSPRNDPIKKEEPEKTKPTTDNEMKSKALLNFKKGFIENLVQTGKSDTTTAAEKPRGTSFPVVPYTSKTVAELAKYLHAKEIFELDKACEELAMYRPVYPFVFVEAHAQRKDFLQKFHDPLSRLTSSGN